MLTFKQFLSQQEDNISDQDAIKKYNEYKDEFKRQQINEFFLAHKEEEWYLVYIQVCVTCKKISTDYLLIDVTNVKSDNFYFLFHSCLIYIEKKMWWKVPRVMCVINEWFYLQDEKRISKCNACFLFNDGNEAAVDTSWRILFAIFISIRCAQCSVYYFESVRVGC